MTPSERAAVHAMAGAFQRLSMAAELAFRDARKLGALNAARKQALQEFAAAQDALAAAPESGEPQPPPEDADTASPPPALSGLPSRAGGGPASTGARVRDIALQLGRKGAFTAAQVARETGRSLAGCASALSILKGEGLLTYAGPSPSARQRGARGTYSLAGAAPQPVPAPPPAPAAPVVHPPRGRTAKQELAAAEAFLADKPALPKARPVVAHERGVRRA